MRASTLARPSLMFAMAGLAMPAHATTVLVDYSPTATGTDITIGASATPQFDFFELAFSPYTKDYITANGSATVAMPGFASSADAVSAFLPLGYMDGDYAIAFDIGADAFTGTFTVDGLGDHISEIDYDGPAVPEPPTWAMMLLGMGVVGAALRTRRQREDQTGPA